MFNGVRNFSCLTFCFAFLVLPTIHAQAMPLRVVASFSILGDMAKQVGGEAVEVETLVGPNGDLHMFQPTPDDAKKVAKADLVIINGLGYESWAERLIKASGTKAKILVASDGVKARFMEEEGRRILDPHAWQDVANGRLYAQNIARQLEQLLPAQAAAIRESAARYEQTLVALDQNLHERFGSIPLTRRKIITSHDAFGYFGAAYGVAFLSPLGISTESEPSAKEVARLVRQIKAEGVKTVFMENMTNPKLIAQIAKDTGARMGGELYADSLSPPDGQAPTYVEMMRGNAEKLLAAMR